MFKEGLGTNCSCRWLMYKTHAVAAQKPTIGTIFLGDDLHEYLRREAFRSKVSMAELIRIRLEAAPRKSYRRCPSKDSLMKVTGICIGPALSNDIDAAVYGGSPAVHRHASIRSPASL
jgi:hypothetical protein